MVYQMNINKIFFLSLLLIFVTVSNVFSYEPRIIGKSWLEIPSGLIQMKDIRSILKNGARLDFYSYSSALYPSLQFASIKECDEYFAKLLPLIEEYKIGE